MLWKRLQGQTYKMLLVSRSQKGGENKKQKTSCSKTRRPYARQRTLHVLIICRHTGDGGLGLRSLGMPRAPPQPALTSYPNSPLCPRKFVWDRLAPEASMEPGPSVHSPLQHWSDPRAHGTFVRRINHTQLALPKSASAFALQPLMHLSLV